ncbi:MAG: MgtC/SapB family protein [Desulfitobacteriaceae bacterium]|nr:MgtC/SapB family protein [Desulfitobacteriaceae bacterium]
MSIQLQAELALRLFFALIIGGLIGSERYLHNKPAGARTHSLVCLASALFMIISIYGFSGSGSGSGINRDPARLAAQVISGMGFIGAGVIWKEGFNVKGLTTATTLWLTSGLGLASGAGMYILAIVSAALSYIALHFFYIWENALNKKRVIKGISYQLEGINFKELENEIAKIIHQPIQYEVTGQSENFIITYQFIKNIPDPFYLTIGLKEDIIQVIIFRMPADMRNQGLGSSIIQTLIQWGKINEFEKITVISRSDALNFWRRNGFTKVDDKSFVFEIEKSN